MFRLVSAKLNRRTALAALLLGIGLLAGCSKTPPLAFQGTDITDAPLGGEFRLTDHTGKPRALSDFKGKVVVVFFGYTHCPDACPTTMSELAAAMKQLGDKAHDVQVLFISVDPERDTAALLAQYVPSFNPSFLGLLGTPTEIKTVVDQFKVMYQKVPIPGGDGKNYSIDHSAGSYIFDKTGKIRIFVNYGAGSAVFAHDIGLLLAA
ncbi:MAG: SCO family protein [Burkholderiales bacterium]|nr:SCO family protein [Burkholderiales bacterium]